MWRENLTPIPIPLLSSRAATFQSSGDASSALSSSLRRAKRSGAARLVSSARARAAGLSSSAGARAAGPCASARARACVRAAENSAERAARGPPPSPAQARDGQPHGVTASDGSRCGPAKRASHAPRLAPLPLPRLELLGAARGSLPPAAAPPRSAPPRRPTTRRWARAARCDTNLVTS